MIKKMKKAFTLVELLVVIAIIAILATVSVVGYTAFIKKAAISNDETLVGQLNSYLNAWETSNLEEVTPDNIRDITNHILVDSGITELSPQSIKYGYHFYFDFNKNEYSLVHDNDAIQSVSSRRFFRTRRMTTNDNDVPEMSFTKTGYFFLDTAGSELAETIQMFYAVDSRESFATFYEKAANLTTDKGNAIPGVVGLINRSIFASNHGNFTTVRNANIIFFNDNIETINNVKDVYNTESKSWSTSNISESNPLVTLTTVGMIEIPSTVTVVSTKSLTIKCEETVGEETPLMSFSVESVEVLATMVDYSFTNVSFIINNNNELVYKYVEESNTIVLVSDGSTIVDVTPKNVLTNFTFGYESASDDKIQMTNDTIYVAYDLGSFRLFGTDFVGANGNENITSTSLTWTATADYLTVDSSGNVTITALPDIDKCESTITAKALVGDCEKTITIYVVRVTSATFTLGNKTLEMSSGINSEVELGYDGSSKEFNFDNLEVGRNYSGLTLDAFISASTNGDAFDIVGNTLVLKRANETQIVTIKIGEYLTKDFNVTIINNSSPYEVKLENTKTYLYRVGNKNAISLRNLFMTISDITENATLTIYDASKTYGGGLKQEISTSSTGFAATYTKELTASNWENSTIKFNGNGVAILELQYQDKKIELALEVVEAYNVTAYSELKHNQNNVLLSDIKMPKDKYWNIAVNTCLYGNGFTFDITEGVINNQPGIIQLDGKMDNVKVIGSVYPSFSGSISKDYYTAAIRTKAGAVISNSYIANCSSALKAEGDLYVENSTFFGGRFANIEIRGGTITLDNVTTINQPYEEKVGLGIVVYNEARADTKIIIKNQLTQYNWLKQTDKQYFSNNLHKYAFDAMFKEDFSSLHFDYNGVKYVNTGIVFLNGYDNIEGVPTNYRGIEAKLYTYKGKVYSFDNSLNTFNREMTEYPKYSSNFQCIFEPIFKLNEFEKDVTDTDKRYAYTENGIVKIGISTLQKDSYSLDLVKLASINKYSGQNISINYSCNGAEIDDKTITFRNPGTYTIIFSIRDESFFDISGNSLNGMRKDYSYELEVQVADTDMPNASLEIGTNSAVYASKFAFRGDDYFLYVPITGLTITDYEWNENTQSYDAVTKIVGKDWIEGLTVTCSGDYAPYDNFQINNDILYISSYKAANNKGNYTATITISYIGANFKEVTITQTYNFTLDTAEVKSANSTPFER